jgi:hypothetical protein
MFRCYGMYSCANVDLASLSWAEEGALGAFGEYFSPSTLAAAFCGLFQSQGTCTVANLASQPSGLSSAGLDAGPSLTLTGQAGSWTLMPTSAGEYQARFGSTPSGADIPPGSYTVAGGVGRDVGAFSANLTVGGTVLWANKQGISTVDRTQPLTVAWSGGTRPGDVLTGGYSESNTGGHLTFMCSEDISKGSFTIPSFILSALPASTGGTMFMVLIRYRGRFGSPAWTSHFSLMGAAIRGQFPTA